MAPGALNYQVNATVDDGSCYIPIYLSDPSTFDEACFEEPCTAGRQEGCALNSDIETVRQEAAAVAQLKGWEGSARQVLCTRILGGMNATGVAPQQSMLRLDAFLRTFCLPEGAPARNRACKGVVDGCMNPIALNYNPNATIDLGIVS